MTMKKKDKFDYYLTWCFNEQSINYKSKVPF